MFVLNEYEDVKRPIEFTLRSGGKVKAVYLENYMTASNLDKLDESRQGLNDGRVEINDLHKAYSKHLSLALVSIEVGQKGEGGKVTKMPDKTATDRYAILRCLSYQDLGLMIGQIAGDLGRPLDSDETNLSDGSEPKEKSETAQETEKAT